MSALMTVGCFIVHCYSLPLKKIYKHWRTVERTQTMDKGKSTRHVQCRSQTPKRQTQQRHKK
jgi:hypothetical protein